MANTPYKPSEAVILFVQGPEATGQQGGIFKVHLLTGTYYPIASPAELDFVQQLLTARKIPWDNFGQATGNMLGFGVEIPR